MDPHIITEITVNVERHAVTAQQVGDAGGDRTHEPRDFARRRRGGRLEARATAVVRQKTPSTTRVW
jgi:hypothetical protein